MDGEKEKYSYEYPRPALTADCVIFGFDGVELRILLIERGIQPYLGYWALPGGFMRIDESIEDCAKRELLEETAIKNVYLKQFHCFSSVERDPRGRVVTVAFIALVRPSDHSIVGGDDAHLARWFNVDELPPLAFDHHLIITEARNYLKEMLALRPAAFHLLDEVFSIDELRRVYEVINRTSYDRRNFHKKLLKARIVEDAYDFQEGSCSQSACREPSPTYEKDCISSGTPDRKGRPPKLFRMASRIQDIFKTSEDGKPDYDDDGSMKNLFNF